MQFSFHINTHQLGVCLHQTLCGHHHFHFAGADTKSDGSESTMGGCMAVTANDGHTGLGESQFGSDYMHDSLIRMSKTKEFDAKFFTILFKCIHLEA